MSGIDYSQKIPNNVELSSDKLPVGKRVRLVQISDLHVERLTRRERALVDQVNALDANHH